MESAFPKELGGMFRKMESKGNPWGLSARKRMDWTKNLDFEVPVIGDDVEALWADSEMILKVKEELYTILSEHSGQPFETIQRDSDRDYWMTANEALEYGMIDRVLSRKG